MMALTWHIFTFTSNGHQAMTFMFAREGSTCTVLKKFTKNKLDMDTVLSMVLDPLNLLHPIRTEITEKYSLIDPFILLLR